MDVVCDYVFRYILNGDFNDVVAIIAFIRVVNDFEQVLIYERLHNVDVVPNRSYHDVEVLIRHTAMDSDLVSVDFYIALTTVYVVVAYVEAIYQEVHTTLHTIDCVHYVKKVLSIRVGEQQPKIEPVKPLIPLIILDLGTIFAVALILDNDVLRYRIVIKVS